MKTKIKLTALSVITSALLVGCGGGGSSADATSTGYLVDSPVYGCEYTTDSGIKGTTDEYGRFKYNDGDEVEFHLGNLSLGKSKPDTKSFITPTYLIAGEPTEVDANETQKVTLLLQLLQSLDSDNNATNGIYIEPTVLDSLSDINETNIHDVNESYLMDLDTEHDLGLDNDYDGHLDVNETSAQGHFDDSKKEFMNDSDTKPDDDDHKSMYQNNKPDETDSSSEDSHGDFNLSAYPVTQNLTQSLKNSLAYMGNEERLAYDVYTNLYNYHNNNGLEINNEKESTNRYDLSILNNLKDKFSKNNLEIKVDNNYFKIKITSQEDIEQIANYFNNI